MGRHFCLDFWSGIERRYKTQVQKKGYKIQNASHDTLTCKLIRISAPSGKAFST
eukprot:c53799_g1_i1 orf=226-387(+)